MCDGKSCYNCGYAERDDCKRNHPKMYCTNRKSEKCFGWVESTDVCEWWIEYSQRTKYYND